MFRLNIVYKNCLNNSMKTVRFYAKSKANVIKDWNYESKALFGASQKLKKSKSDKNVNKQNNNENIDDKVELIKNNIDTERFWLIDYRSNHNNHNNHDNDFNKNNKKKTQNKNAKEYGKVIEVKSLFDCIDDIKSELQNNIPENKIIPFNSNQLRNLLQFPLFYTEDLKNPIITEKNDEFLEIESSFKLPSVGKILQATMSDNARNALIKWKIGKIAELGEEGFENLQKENLRQGRLFHSALQEYLVNYETPVLDPSIEGVWKSVTSALESLKPETKIIEARIKHPYLKYCGVVDYVSKIESNLSVVEWKKSDKIKSKIDFTYDAPIQLCAYLGALSADPQYKLNANSGFVIVAYTDGQPAQIHRLNEINLQNYWFLWRKRLQEYWIRYRDGTLPEPI